MKRTPLYEIHVKYGGKIIDFGGWELPVQYKGILEEHEQVRTAAGLFDVSHMGEITVKGSAASDYIQKLVTNDISRTKAGQVVYSPMCYQNGGIVDDLLIYKLGSEDYLLVVNASNTDKDFAWMKAICEECIDDNNIVGDKVFDGQMSATEVTDGQMSDTEVTDGQMSATKVSEGQMSATKIPDVQITNASDEYAQLAVQGPKAEEILQRLTNTRLSEIKFFHFEKDVGFKGVKALVSRTGYTGEDGFEIYLCANDAVALWEMIIGAGKEDGLIPAGLGARDTLRFEVCLPLYGQEISPDISPLEAGLDMFVKLDKYDFIGREALLAQKTKGKARKLVGFEMRERGIPRSHYEIHSNGEYIGVVTTGSFSPTLKTNIGLALIKAEYAKPEGEFDVIIRNKQTKAKIIDTPFYSKKYKFVEKQKGI